MLISTIFTVIPTLGTNESIKIGIIGPVGLPHWSPAGMKEAAELAAQKINDEGGISVGGVPHTVELFFENEYALPEPNIPAAQQAVQNLYDAGCRIIIGGFRTEVTGPMIEKAMAQAEPVIFLINGASTNELLDSVLVDYEKYKYLFRINPVNSTMLLHTIGGGIQALVARLLPIFESEGKIKVAVLTEDLTWTQVIHMYLTNPAIYPAILGTNVEVVYNDRVPETAIDLSSYIGNIMANEARIVIHVFSGRVGVYFTAQWGTVQVPAIPVGINVLAQLQTHWESTGGLCEYESILNFVGTRTAITPEAIEFWDEFVEYTGGVWPIYTAFGAYNGIYYNLKEAIEAAGTTDADAIVAELEIQEMAVLNGLSKFTVSHDVFSNSAGPTWPSPQYTRAIIVQWLAGRMEVVSPMDQVYSKRWAIPPWMYELIVDVNYDGIVDIRDITAAAMAFGSTPEHPRWEKEADLNFDGMIDIRDITMIAMEYGNSVELPIPYPS